MEEMTKMLSMMTMMREAMGMNHQTREKSSIGEIVNAIKELKGAAAEFAPEEKEPDSLMGMLPKVLEMVSAGQAAQAAPQAYQQAYPQDAYIPPVQVPQSVQQPVQPIQPVQSQPEGDNVNIMTMMKLKGYLKTLCDMAQTKTVQEGADFVYEKLPDDLIEIMALDNWFDLLSGVAPQVKPHKDWFVQVRDTAMSLFDPEEEEQTSKTSKN